MSGHSKWATTKRQKAANDAKRSSLFTKLSKAVAIAARDGADPETNFKLRVAIDRAKKYSLPKDNIERAIKSGSGQDDGTMMEEITYEGYGPGGTAFIVETITDNRNRTASEIKHLFSKHGGNIGGSGSVIWMFDRKGVLYLKNKVLSDEQELALIDAGAEDIKKQEDNLVIYSVDINLKKVEDAARALTMEVEDSGLEYIAKESVQPEKESVVIGFMEAIDDLDDVQTVYTNANI
ncbi:MAG: YebC/PmpR family DNA-binding transcriptional regulator [Candidatus Komeilibacteria bacterium]|nr:YebC/PmpR family DNA-binding transcriptional regulator [Candidatus Komeilibacteria bacterium]